MRDSKKTKATKRKVAKKVGDTIEKAGKKISGMGATKVGKKVQQYGNKIEHSQDK